MNDTTMTKEKKQQQQHQDCNLEKKSKAMHELKKKVNIKKVKY